ncbi:hypothetical protein [Silvibacterium sp.]|uniref:hypothetical protein n=1 Tax=Silvibacterium sp. TaxID=1964179 RepID=UPI0039E66802
MNNCTDPVIGDILSSWRYDISGISPEMRADYEGHFAECAHCRHRQRLHRTVDIALIAVSTLSILAFLLALAVIHHVEPLRNWALVMHLDHRNVALTLQMAAIAGLLFSMLCWVLIAITIPAPVYLAGMAQARFLLHDRLSDDQGHPRNVA